MKANMDVTLPQAILLLSLDDTSGKTEDGYYQPAFAGAALAELMLRETIAVEDGEIVPLRHNQQLGAFLAQCDARIGGATKRHGLSYWVSALAHQKDFIATLADELCHLGALSKETTRIFGLFTRTVWPEASPKLGQNLKAEMAAAMFEQGRKADEPLCLTIAIAHTVDLLAPNFETEKLTAHTARISEIADGACLERSDLKALIAAIKAAIESAHSLADDPTAQIIQ